jgi:hypothetical protein
MSKMSPLFTWRSAIVASEISSTCKVVALVLSLHMSELGDSCFPGQRRLAKECSLNRATIQRALADLEVSGWLFITRSGNRSTNDYCAVIPAQTGRTRRPIVDNGPHRAAGGAAHDDMTGRTERHKDDREVVIEDVGELFKLTPEEHAAKAARIRAGLVVAPAATLSDDGNDDDDDHTNGGKAEDRVSDRRDQGDLGSVGADADVRRGL